jgi:uncharacterized protein HemY
MEHNQTRITALHRRLIEVEDRNERARIHLELGRLMVSNGLLPRASRHFREALWFEPRLEDAETALRSLGEWFERAEQRRVGRLRSLLGWLRLAG